MRAQLVAFFNSTVLEQGFSEVYHMDIATYTEGQTAAAALLTKRIHTLNPDVALIFARISNIDVPGDSAIVEAFEYPQVGDLDIEGKSEPLSTALLLRQEATELRRGMRLLRGIPDDCVDGQEYDPTMDYTTKLNTYKDALLADPWRLKVKGPVLGFSPALVGITRVKNEGRITHRNVGRPFGFAHGRRST